MKQHERPPKILWWSIPLALGAPLTAVLAIAYSMFAPNAPRPETGNVIRFGNFHVYITHTEQFIYNVAIFAGLIGIFSSVIAILVNKNKRRP